jgi:hypothetical protein
MQEPGSQKKYDDNFVTSRINLILMIRTVVFLVFFFFVLQVQADVVGQRARSTSHMFFKNLNAFPSWRIVTRLDREDYWTVVQQDSAYVLPGGRGRPVMRQVRAEKIGDTLVGPTLTYFTSSNDVVLEIIAIDSTGRMSVTQQWKKKKYKGDFDVEDNDSGNWLWWMGAAGFVLFATALFAQRRRFNSADSH